MNELICIKTQDVVDSREWFELKINNSEAASPAFEYAWCLGAKLNKYLLDANVAYPFLISVIYRKDQVGIYRFHSREINDLADGINMLPFDKAGDYMIFCLIAWYNGQPLAKTDYAELAKDQVSVAFLHMDGLLKCNCVKPLLESENVDILPYQIRANFTIDAKQFAPAPPEWLVDWVSFFGSCPKTVAGWWLKCVFSFTVQPIMLGFLALCFYMGSFLVVIGLLAFGVKPWRIKFLEIIKLELDSSHKENMFLCFVSYTDSFPFLMKTVWWYSKGTGEKRCVFERVMLCQPLWLVLVFVCVLVYALYLNLGFYDSFGFFVKTFLSVMLFNYLLCKLRAFVLLFRNTEDHNHKAMERKKAKIRKRIERYYPEKLEPLTCSSLKSFQDIASKKATLSHRLKTALYRPVRKL